MAQAILADTFPPQKRGLAFALYGITAIMAPTIGPTLGGWITDNYSWRWIFYINLPVGILTLFLVIRMVEDPPYLTQLKTAGVRVDYIGIALLALGIGALQVLLDKGQEDDWFGSHFIVTLAVISAVCLVTLVFWEWRQQAPIIDVRMFKNFNFAVSSLMMFFLGVLLFSSLVMMPQFLQTLMGYTAESAGLVLSGAGLVLLFEMPIVGQLTTKIPAKYIMAFGWLCLAVGMYYSTMRVDLLISFKAAAWLRVAQAFGLGFLFVPISLAAYIGVAAGKGKQRCRDWSTSCAISAAAWEHPWSRPCWPAARSFIKPCLTYHATNYDPAFRNQLQGLTQQLVHAGATPPDAQVAAYARIYQSVQIQSQTLAYIDTYMVLAIAASIMFVLTFIVKKNDPRAGGEVAVG